MKKGIPLKKDFSIKLNSQITKYLTPKYIYLPLQEEDQIHAKIEIKKEERISDRLISPVSGQIVGTKYCLTENGEMVKCLAILNDYKETFWERKAVRKTMNKISLEKMLIEIQEYHYDDLFNKLKKMNESQILILNGIEDEPYVANEIFIGKEYTSNVLESLDALREIGHFPKVQIAIKNNDRENIEAYSNFLGTYPNIELVLVPDYYLIGKPRFLKAYLNIQEEALILSPSEIRTIYNTIKRRRYNTETIFTISGDGIENPQIIEAKIGSSVKEILNSHIKIKKNETIHIQVNGLMQGRSMEIENLIVTEGLKSILIMKDLKLPEKKCVNCGKCFAICPMGCNPRRYLKTKDPKDIKDCIDCGLCSYICPSYINLRKVIKGEKNE